MSIKESKGLRLSSVITLLLGLFAIGAIIWIIVSPTKDDAKPQKARLAIGESAPDFEVTNTHGDKVSLADYKGKVVVLNFWASWCEPCVKEMPLINEVYQSNRSDVATLFVNAGESKGTVNEFLAAHHFEFPVMIDVTGKVSGLYGIIGLPVTYIIDKNGNLHQSIVGEISSREQLQTYIQSAASD
ncbi:TlpA family protein disulfide reductase [Paenibacillus woosongensis]|uniref:Redoxin domain-containing protein n=1 Tax=Paenibacillus woosongensis TaxID=307580 RepID=A0A7X2YXX3_9BACL|nr:redoxin domain-containing protein [Paenibacillus woosongensis]MUG43803.1 redoxin domain-containing protein [Paenibacillus woosongensis]